MNNVSPRVLQWALPLPIFAQVFATGSFKVVQVPASTSGLLSRGTDSRADFPTDFRADLVRRISSRLALSDSSCFLGIVSPNRCRIDHSELRALLFYFIFGLVVLMNL